jgi:hypothetical protein
MVSEHGEIAREVLGGCIALPRLLGETAVDDPAQRRRRLRACEADGLRILAEDGGERFRHRLPLEGPVARGHLVEHGAEGELVRSEIDRPPDRLFGRHVSDCAHHDAGLGHGGDRRGVGLLAAVLRKRELRQAEVENLDEPLVGDHHVFGLDVPVDDSPRVGPGEPLGNLRREAEQLAQGERAFGKRLSQRDSFDEFHDEEEARSDLFHLVDRDDVGMVQSGGRARLALETVEPVPVRGKPRRQDLDRDGATEPGVARPVHLAMPPAPRRETTS